MMLTIDIEKVKKFRYFSLKKYGDSGFIKIP